MYHPCLRCSTYCTIFYTNSIHAIHRYDMPRGFKILSLVTCAATSPPFCKAIAPITAYIVVVRTASIPDPSKFCGYTSSVSPTNLPDIQHTFFGFHLIISGTPICVASLASLFIVTTCDIGISDKFAKPSNAGCVNS